MKHSPKNTDEAIAATGEQVVATLLALLGQEIEREGLKDTPRRVFRFWQDVLTPPVYKFTTFDSEGMDEMIIEHPIPVYSFCEHHMAPFFGTAAVAYIPNKRIAGLSKLAWCVKEYASRLQNQERLTQQIADRMLQELSPRGVAVLLKCRHFCMECRGVRTHDVFTTTTCLKGAFKKDLSTRQEFLQKVYGR